MNTITESMVARKKKILLVSDYITVFSGGIEMYISNVAKLVTRDDFQVHFWGLRRSAKLLKKLRSFLLPLTGFNIISAVGFMVSCIKRKPDIIRFHSVNRYHGWLVIWLSTFISAKKLMMYHDLGYFHPFPHLVTQEEQILPFDLSNFVSMGLKAKHPRGWIHKGMVGMAATLKYCSIYCLRLSLLSTVDVHLVPSEFMVKYLEQRGVNKEKIHVLPHFIVSGL